MIPAPSPARKRTIETGAAAHNAYLLANQARCTSGVTFAANLMDETGRVSWRRLDAAIGGRGARPPVRPALAEAPVIARPEDYELPTPLAHRLVGRLYAALLAYADNGDDLPPHAAMVSILGRQHIRDSVYVANMYRDLERGGFIERGRTDGDRWVKIVATGQVLVFEIEGLDQ